jgi:hypothetical protein
MGTNYYRIPTEAEMKQRKQKLQSRIRTMAVEAMDVERGFSFIQDPDGEYDWDTMNPWDEFVDGTNIHLGTASAGWKFCWNFHEGKYYSNKDELIKFIKSGRVISEYGDEIPPSEFLEMAFNWCEPDGLIADAEYFRKNPHSFISDPSKYYDREVDGLRVSSSKEFS